MLLARAAEGKILTLDGRFRMLVEHVAKVRGVWPQVVLLHCANNEAISLMSVVQANVKQFLSNRSFVSLGPDELRWMVLQGGGYLQLGMRRFKDYLSSESTNFDSVLPVAFDFLRQIATLRAHLGAFGELFEHVVEAAMRHKQCPREFDLLVTEFVDLLTESLNPTGHHLYERVALHPLRRLRGHRQYLAQRLKSARQHAAQPPRDRPVAVRVLFCGVVPWLVTDQSRAQGAAQADELEPPHQGEQQAETSA